MSSAFAGGHGRRDVSSATVQKMLDENTQLIQAIVDYQNQGKARECTHYQQILHRNLVYLATLADSGQQTMATQNGSMQQPSSAPVGGPQGFPNDNMTKNMQQHGLSVQDLHANAMMAQQKQQQQVLPPVQDMRMYQQQAGGLPPNQGYPGGPMA